MTYPNTNNSKAIQNVTMSMILLKTRKNTKLPRKTGHLLPKLSFYAPKSLTLQTYKPREHDEKTDSPVVVPPPVPVATANGSANRLLHAPIPETGNQGRVAHHLRQPGLAESQSHRPGRGRSPKSGTEAHTRPPAGSPPEHGAAADPCARQRHLPLGHRALGRLPDRHRRTFAGL